MKCPSAETGRKYVAALIGLGGGEPESDLVTIGVVRHTN